jgi:hypothetical protein
MSMRLAADIFTRSFDRAHRQLGIPLKSDG